MNNKLILTSLTAMMLAMPALATETVDTFPSNGKYMQPDTIYTNAANETNMAGVDGSEDNNRVDANPKYDECENLSNGQFPRTDEDAVSLSQCWRTCAAPDVLHSGSGATLSGKVYLGHMIEGQLNTCTATTCRPGYFKMDVDFLQKVDEWNSGRPGYEAIISAQNGNGDIRQSSTITGDQGPTLLEPGGQPNGTWTVLTANNYEYGWQLYGFSRCLESTDPIMGPFPTDLMNGNTCYCRITGYRPADSDTVYAANSFTVKLGTAMGDWFGTSSFDPDSYDCNQKCAHDCAAVFVNTIGKEGYEEWRASYLNTLLGSASIREKCILNENYIKITWSGVAEGINDSVVINGQTTSSVQYGKDVQTPKKPLSISGKIFKGWQFSKPSN